MQDPYLNSVLEAIASDALDPEGPHLITVDELRAAGALDVPAAWRKSLGAERVERDLFSDLSDDADSEQQASPPREQKCDAAADAPELI